MTIKAGNGTHQNKHDYLVRKLNYFNEKQNSNKKNAGGTTTLAKNKF